MSTFIDIVLYILSCIICYFISGIVHELGHIIVGLANGWKFYLLIIGPLGIKTDEYGKIKLYFEKQVMLWGGVGGTFPTESSDKNIKIWSRVLLGGPIASLVMGAIFLPLGIVTGNLFLILLGVMPLGMGIICILPLPLKTGITYTDGGRWSRLHKSGQEAEEEIALFKLTEIGMTGSNYEAINPTHIEALIKSNELGIRYYGYYYKFKYYKTKANDNECVLALEMMDELKSKVSPIIVKDCIID